MLTIFPEPSDEDLVAKLSELNDFYGFEGSKVSGMIFDFVAMFQGARASFSSIQERCNEIGDYEDMSPAEVAAYLTKRYVLIMQALEQDYMKQLMQLKLKPTVYAEHFISGCASAMPLYQATCCLFCPHSLGSSKCHFGHDFIQQSRTFGETQKYLNSQNSAYAQKARDDFFAYYEGKVKDIQEGKCKIPSDCPNPPQFDEEADALEAFNQAVGASGVSNSVGAPDGSDYDDEEDDDFEDLYNDPDSELWSKDTSARKKRLKPSTNPPGRAGKHRNRCFYGFDFDSAKALADFIDGFNFRALLILKMSGKFKDILDEYSETLQDTRDPSDIYEARIADTEKLDKIVIHQQAMFDADEQLALAEAGSLIYNQTQSGFKKLYYILLDTSGSMTCMLSNGCTAAEVAAAISLSFVDEAQKVGKYMMRTFEYNVSPLSVASEEHSFLLTKRKLLTCSFNGGGTNISAALLRAQEDYQTLSDPDIKKAETILITDGQDDVPEEVLKELVKHCDLHFIFINTAGKGAKSRYGSYYSSEEVIKKYAKTCQEINGDNFDQFQVVENIARNS